MTTIRDSRSEAGNRIEMQIAAGETLATAVIEYAEELSQEESRYTAWDDYNQLLLKRLFSDDSVATEYKGVHLGRMVRVGTIDEFDAYKELLQKKLTKLRSIHQRLELWPEVDRDSAATSTSTSPQESVSREVFVVHGRDHGLKEAVARFVDQVGYEPVILHERPDRSATVIEKLEREARSAVFAIVILTPDDEGRLREQLGAELVPRARQNVILELGYFLGTVGRSRVVALLAEGIQEPSDIRGVLYKSVPSVDDLGWRVGLAREMRAAGLDVDIDSLIGPAPNST